MPKMVPETNKGRKSVRFLIFYNPFRLYCRAPPIPSRQSRWTEVKPRDDPAQDREWSHRGNEIHEKVLGKDSITNRFSGSSGADRTGDYSIAPCQNHRYGSKSANQSPLYPHSWNPMQTPHSSTGDGSCYACLFGTCGGSERAAHLNSWIRKNGNVY